MTEDKRTDMTRELRSLFVRWAIVLAVLGVFAVWATWRMGTAASRLPALGASVTAQPADTEPEIEYWTCTMDPDIRQDGLGDCPRCGMDLVPKYVGSDEPGVKPVADSAGGMSHQEGHTGAGAEKPQAWYRCTMPECGDTGSPDPDSRCPVCGMKRERVDTGGGSGRAAEITLNDRARRLAEVETEAVQERLLFKRLRTVGRVTYDETRIRMASAWTGGRIDRLFADFSGMRVSEGDHLVEIYSPELLTAQEEYLQALRAAEAARGSSTEIVQRNSEQLLQSVRRKLELLGVTTEQMVAIEESGEPGTHLVVYAPIGGTIIEKRAMEGMYVRTGDVLYTIADLTHLWLLIDLYEADLPWVAPFQEVRVTTRSLPGEAFIGQIVFVDPRVDPKTRTIPVRIHVDNSALRLKPDMWVVAEVNAALGQGGRGVVSSPDKAYACPMHPWEAADEMRACPICEMDMMPVEELPQYSTPTDAVPLLAVPRGAVMQTGERTLAYIETAPATYRGAEVTLGPLAHDGQGREFYPVLSGLEGGEMVVKRGNFAIDSQMQLAGKPSLFAARGWGEGESADDESHSAHADVTTPPEESEQKLCPVLGHEIDPGVYTDYRSVRVYFCCPPCIEEFEGDPMKYIEKLPKSVQSRLSDVGAKEGRHD